MPPTIKVNLSWQERRALELIAEENSRRPSEHLRWLLIEEIRKRCPESTVVPDHLQKGHAGADVSHAAVGGGVKLALEAPGNGQRRHVGA